MSIVQSLGMKCELRRTLLHAPILIWCGMDASLLQACNEFAAIALGVALAYLLLIGLALKLAHVFRRFARKHRPGTRPGEDVHQALKLTGRLWDHCRTAALLFLVSFLLLLNFGRYGWWVPLSLASNILIACVLAAPLIFALLKFIQLCRYRNRLGRLLEKHNAVAEQLVGAQVRGNRVFHSVRLGDAVLDHVIVGRNGVYTVQLFLPPSGAEIVTLAQGSLLYQPGASRTALHQYSKAVRLLREALAAEINSSITVLPVIVVPDCMIEHSDQRSPMLVSLRTCMSLVGWHDKSAYLMDEDIAVISAWLTSQSLTPRVNRMREAVAVLDRQVGWPNLVG